MIDGEIDMDKTATLVPAFVLANILMYASMYDYGRYSLHVLVACVLALIPLEVYKHEFGPEGS
jgi:hypothetical protein